MAIARIVDGAVAEQRDLDLSAVPEHKRGAWKPIEGEAPSYNARIATITGPVYQIEENRVLRVWTVTPRDLATVKAELKTDVDLAAEDCRVKYITPGAGQAMTYEQKSTEARTFAAMAGAGAYPFLDAMVTAGRAPDRATAAAMISQAEAGWAVIGSQIEMLRERAKLQIEAATTHDAAVAAAQVEWPS